jgi:putative ABC transport system permease protein
MKFLPLIWSGIWRKPGRTMLIFLQISVVFALFGVLQGLKTGVAEVIARARADVLYVAPQGIGAAPLPDAYARRIKAMPGVKAVFIDNGFLATYQNPRDFIFVYSINPDPHLRWLAPDIFDASPADLRALAKDRTGALVSADLERKYGWKVGDRIPLQSTTLQSNGSKDWAFDIVGTYREHQIGLPDNYLVINNDYFDAARLADKGTAQLFLVLIDDPRKAAAVSDAIDDFFANSPDATRTVSYREASQLLFQRIGDLNFVIRAIVSAALGALLFSVATMLKRSIRERTPELAVLKTLGFTGGGIFILLLAEAATVCIAAAACGLALATLSFPFAAKLASGISMPWIVIAVGFAGALGLALLSAALPALRAARLEVAAALGGR